MERVGVIRDWKVLKPVSSSALRKVFQTQHEAVQLVAIAGEYLIPEEDDDSHTSLNFSADQMLLYSGLIEGNNECRVGLHLRDLTLEILTHDLKLIGMFDLHGHTTTEAYNFLEKRLSETGVDISSMKLKLHWGIPTGPVEKERTFSVSYIETIEETIKYRHNIILLLKYFSNEYDTATSIRTWPNHFDTAMRIPLETIEGKISSSFGLGFSINDEMLDVPYFYINLHTDKDINFPSKPPLLKYGQWSTENWNGAYFKIDNIHELPGEKQAEVLLEFFDSVIHILLNIFDKK